MNADNFEKWTIKAASLFTSLKYTLLTYLLVIIQLSHETIKSSSMCHMVDYLRENGIACDEKMRKQMLYQLIEKIKPSEKMSRTDQSCFHLTCVS